MATLPCAQPAKRMTVPADHGLRPDDHEGGSPLLPDSRQPDPQHAVACRKPDSRTKTDDATRGSRGATLRESATISARSNGHQDGRYCQKPICRLSRQWVQRIRSYRHVQSLREGLTGHRLHTPNDSTRMRSIPAPVCAACHVAGVEAQILGDGELVSGRRFVVRELAQAMGDAGTTGR